ncbi:molybdopterin-guanine dinucleotide biosynthesis protein B [Achromobacter animicus]|uniref:molybdopterin-guanine dinucleotide biosynthesis protein B n=1 Tax=Achromobacter animicus TaxID=1389935 RepID=UPI0028ACA9F1|nr:molybdopterin-guanine dinucleotide biosynthesis protein B [Achromobacter animicus]
MTPVFGIAGRSGSGKTTLIEAMLPLLGARGLRVNVIKHSHHDFQMEPPGKDSARFRTAGAQEVMIASPYRYAIVHELRDAPEPTLEAQLARLSPADLVLVEGFKQAAIPRIEVYRPALGKPPLHTEDPTFVAVVTDAPLNIALPCLPLNEPTQVADFLCRTLGLR